MKPSPPNLLRFNISLSPGERVREKCKQARLKEVK
jgi:hypothetical protein